MQGILKDTADKLRTSYDAEEAQQIALLLLEKLSGLSRAQMLTRAFDPDSTQLQLLESWLKSLKQGEPVQYVLGETEFFGLPFVVSPAVLIPRPETEELVEWILEDWRAINDKSLAILDIGTGSGCIPVSLKKKLSAADLSAVDISAEALQIAHKNATINRVEVNFIRDNILAPTANYGIYDVVVSNPPYIPLSDRASMQMQVKQYEPALALFVEEDDPLIFYRKIAQFAQQQLNSNGKLYFETHYRLADQVKVLLESLGFKHVQIRKDISGNERMVRAEL